MGCIMADATGCRRQTAIHSVARPRPGFAIELSQEAFPDGFFAGAGAKIVIHSIVVLSTLSKKLDRTTALAVYEPFTPPILRLGRPILSAKGISIC